MAPHPYIADLCSGVEMDISRHGWTLDPGGHEWLMGFPIGWTDCDAPATAWSRYKQQLRSAYLRIVQGSGLGRT